MSSTQLTFASRDAHHAWLTSQAALPAGFRVGTARLEFTPREAPKPAQMTLTLLALDAPTRTSPWSSHATRCPGRRS